MLVCNCVNNEIRHKGAVTTAKWICVQTANAYNDIFLLYSQLCLNKKTYMRKEKPSEQENAIPGIWTRSLYQLENCGNKIQRLLISCVSSSANNLKSNNWTTIVGAAILHRMSFAKFSGVVVVDYKYIHNLLLNKMDLSGAILLSPR